VTSGIVSKPLRKTAQILAASTTLQGIMTAAHGSAASAAGALEHVHVYEGTDKDDEHPRPRVIVGFGNDWNDRKLGTGAWFGGGTVEICFEFNEDDAADENESNLLAFADAIGAIIDECKLIAGQGNAGDGESYINIVEFSGQGRPDFSIPQEQNGETYLIANYTARWEG
jgi:hypothetical protein